MIASNVPGPFSWDASLEAAAAVLGPVCVALIAVSQYRSEKGIDRRLAWYERAIAAFTKCHFEFRRAALLTEWSEDMVEQALVDAWGALEDVHSIGEEAQLYASPETALRLRSSIDSVYARGELWAHPRDVVGGKRPVAETVTKILEE